jgi:hypothetical protein
MPSAQINFHGLNPLRPEATILITESNGEHNFSEYPLTLTMGHCPHDTLLGIKNTKIGYCRAQNDRGDTIHLPCIVVNFELPKGKTLEEHFVVTKILPKNVIDGETFDIQGDWSKLNKLTVETLRTSNIVFSLMSEALLPYSYYFVNNLEFCDEDELEELFN